MCFISQRYWVYWCRYDPTNLQNFLLYIWEKIQKTGRDKNSAREAGTETDECFPPGPRDGVRIVSQLGEQFEWKHSTEEGDDSHGQQCDDLLCVETCPQKYRLAMVGDIHSFSFPLLALIFKYSDS